MLRIYDGKTPEERNSEAIQETIADQIVSGMIASWSGAGTTFNVATGIYYIGGSRYDYVGGNIVANIGDLYLWIDGSGSLHTGITYSTSGNILLANITVSGVDDPTAEEAPESEQLHNNLSGRNASDGHPISAITNLAAQLAGIGVDIDWQNSVIEFRSAPPVSPSSGDRYIVSSGSGDWAGKDDQIAQWDGEATTPSWLYTTPSEGFTAWVKNSEGIYFYDGLTPQWIRFEGKLDHQQLSGAGSLNHAQLDSDVGANNIHRGSDGKNHSDVGLNNSHRTGNGADHANVALSDTHRGSAGTDHSDVGLANTHRAAVIGNPHAVTKSEVGLGNVTDDAQLKRESGDINSFAEKTSLAGDDVILIEDSEDAATPTYSKKKAKLSSLVAYQILLGTEFPE